MSEDAIAAEQETDKEADGAGQGAAMQVPENPFDQTDLAEFDAADISAGSSICKMLSILFIYTLIAMSCVAWWTSNVSSD